MILVMSYLWILLFFIYLILLVDHSSIIIKVKDCNEDHNKVKLFYFEPI